MRSTPCRDASALRVLLVALSLFPITAHAQVVEPVTVASERATPEDDRALSMLAFAQLFARHASYRREDTPAFNAFELQRAEIGTGLSYRQRHGFILNFEAIRSAGPRSTFGIDENAMVLRVKHAFATTSPAIPGPGALTLRAGLLPDVWVELVEQAYDLRAISALGSERSGLYESSDLGASLRYALFEERLEVRASLTNGEGRSQVELNSGKNTTVTLTGRSPLFFWRGHRARLGVHLSWRDGSTGYASQASHRLAGAITLAHPMLFAGAEVVRARGHSGVGSLQGMHLGVWANVAPVVDWAGVYVKAQRFTPDVSVAAHRTILHGGLYADLFSPTSAPRSVLGFPRLRAYVGYEGLRDDPLAAPVSGTPEATNQHALMLTLSARASATLLADSIQPSRLGEDETKR